MTQHCIFSSNTILHCIFFQIIQYCDLYFDNLYKMYNIVYMILCHIVSKYGIFKKNNKFYFMF